MLPKKHSIAVSRAAIEAESIPQCRRKMNSEQSSPHPHTTSKTVLPVCDLLFDIKSFSLAVRSYVCLFISSSEHSNHLFTGTKAVWILPALYCGSSITKTGSSQLGTSSEQTLHSQKGKRCQQSILREKIRV